MGARDFIGNMASKAGSMAQDAGAGIRQVTTNIGGAIAKTAGSDALEAIGSTALDAVPVVGEIAGLGLLIHGLVKAHQQKESANPQASASSSIEEGVSSHSLFNDQSAKVGAMV